MPGSDALKKLQAMPVLQENDIGYEQQQRDKQWMWEILGHIQHICKVRMDCKAPTNKCARHSHAPCPMAIKCVKQIAHFLIGTKDVGLSSLVLQTPSTRISSGIVSRKKTISSTRPKRSWPTTQRAM
eukprot:7389944-Prymnesium_polylepis.1